MATFTKLKDLKLSNVDLSRKGSVDERIQDLIQFINSRSEYFTTSSCSGRIIIFSESCGDTKKKGCKWLYATHDHSSDDALTVLDDIDGDAVLKFEPFVLHVQCQSICDAKAMHTCALEAGFRNSGITVGKHEKFILAVRSTHGLEVPLSKDGQLLVTHDYVKFLLTVANGKMDENWRRTTKFFDILRNSLNLVNDGS